MKLNNIKYVLCLLLSYSQNLYAQTYEENLEKIKQNFDEEQQLLIQDLLNQNLAENQLTTEKMMAGYRQLIAVSLANQSITHRTDPLKSQLAIQAFDMYSKNGGYPYVSSIYNALHYAKKSAFGDTINMISGHDKTMITQINRVDDVYHTLGDDGQLLIWEKTELGFKRKIVDQSYIVYIQGEELDIFESSLDSQHIEHLSTNKKGMSLISNGLNVKTGLTRFLQIDPSTDQYTVIELEEYTGELLKIFPVGNGWHVLSNTQLTRINAEDPEKVTANVYPFQINVIDVFQSGKGYYLLGGKDVYEFDITTNKQVNIGLKIQEFPTIINATADSKIIAIGDALGKIMLYDVINKTPLEELIGHTSRVSALQFSSNGKRLVSGGFDKVLNIWDMEDFTKEPIQFNDHSSFITSVHLDEVDNLILVGEANGDLKSYSLNNKETVEQLCIAGSEPLSEKEWIRYIGKPIIYDPYTCNSPSF